MEANKRNENNDLNKISVMTKKIEEHIQEIIRDVEEIYFFAL